MIKFFRHIRQQLLSEGKTGKYLKYAIGEIILVVIGILIALQINNWNEEKKLNKIEHSYLKRLSSDLANDSLYWSNSIQFKAKKIESINAIYRFAFSKRKDTVLNLMNDFLTVLYWGDMNPNNNTFKEMISSGNLDLIKNDSIKTKLLALDQDYKRVANWDKVTLQGYTDVVWPATTNVNAYNQVVIDKKLKEAVQLNIDFTPAEQKIYLEEFTKDALGILENRSFSAGIARTRDDLSRQQVQLKRILNDIIRLKAVIDNEIKAMSRD